MRSLTSALQAAIGGPVQRPAWLVEITMTAVTLRLSSFGTLTWDGFTWTADDVDVSDLKVGALEVSGRLVLGNIDDTYGAVFLNESPSDRPVRIWGYDAGATATGDPVLLVPDAVGGGAQFGTPEVSIGLRDRTEFLVGPRAIVSRAHGFNTLLPAGRTLVINGVSFKLERSR